MKSTGIVRKLDPLGRIVLPKELRDLFQLNAQDQVDIQSFGDEIIITKYSTSCCICGASKNLKSFKGKKLCTDCIIEISK